MPMKKTLNRGREGYKSVYRGGRKGVEKKKKRIHCSNLQGEGESLKVGASEMKQGKNTQAKRKRRLSKRIEGNFRGKQ